MISKLICQRKHAKMRANQRYGLDLNKRALQDMCNQIQTGTDAKFVARQSYRVTIWQIQYKGQQLWAVYDRIRHTVITFLPQQLTYDIIKEQVHTGTIDLKYD